MFCIFDLYFDLLCTYESDTLSYDNPDYGSCWLTSVGMEEKAGEGTINLYPNPFREGQPVTISTAGIITRIEIISSQGILQKTLKGLNERTIRTDLDHLSPGIYFMIIQHKKGDQVIKKIVKR